MKLLKIIIQQTSLNLKTRYFWDLVLVYTYAQFTGAEYIFLGITHFNCEYNVDKKYEWC